MKEVIVRGPKTNDDARRDSSYRLDDELRRTFPEWLAKNGITPETHPLVCDLFAGDGSIARIMADNGWPSEGITCIDIAKSPTPLVEGVDWKYWDLEELINAILIEKESELPEEVLALKEKFDIVTVACGPIKRGRRALCDFFRCPGGLVPLGYS